MYWLIPKEQHALRQYHLVSSVVSVDSQSISVKYQPPKHLDHPIAEKGILESSAVVGTWLWLVEIMMADAGTKTVKNDTETQAVKAGTERTGLSGEQAKTETTGAASGWVQSAKQARADSNSDLRTRVRASTLMTCRDHC